MSFHVLSICVNGVLPSRAVDETDAGSQFGQSIRNCAADPNEPAALVAGKRATFEQLDPQLIVCFYKANWPTSPVTMDSSGFGFKVGEFPQVQAPALMVYGKDNPIFVAGISNSTPLATRSL